MLMLGLFDGTPFINLQSDDEITRIALSLHENEPYLQLMDKNKNQRATLGRTELKHQATGSTEIRHESSLVLSNEKGNVLWAAP
jgi:hypothetical protein